MKITSKIEGGNDKEIFELKHLKTPLEKELPPGIHEMLIRSEGESGSIESKIEGVVNGKKKGNATGTFKNTILKAGPNGRYEANHE